MLYDPTFQTWRAFGVTLNSQMMPVSPDLNAASSLFYGFGNGEQQSILDSLDSFSAQ